jgi:leucyl aminopeptidase
MAGGAAVIGAMQAIARLKPGIAVTGIISEARCVRNCAARAVSCFRCPRQTTTG